MNDEKEREPFFTIFFFFSKLRNSPFRANSCNSDEKKSCGKGERRDLMARRSRVIIRISPP